MKPSTNQDTRGLGRSVAPALVLAALVPAICVLWFMSAAIRNEQLAVQQKLSSLYTSHLMTVQRGLESFWKDRATELESLATHPPAQRFAIIVRSDLADSAVIRDRSGNLAYPGPPKPNAPAATETHADWGRARELEFREKKYRLAAERYHGIAEEAASIAEQVKATQAEAICWMKAGDHEKAVDTLHGLVEGMQPGETIGASGELVRPNLQLRLLKLLGDPSHAWYETTLNDLAALLNDYREDRLPASQRLFLMQELRTLAPDRVEFPTEAAERLAAAYLETNPEPMPPGRLGPTASPGVWHFTASGEGVTALLREDTLRGGMERLIAGETALIDARVSLLAPGESAAGPVPVPLVGAGEALPGWRLMLSFEGTDPFARAARRQTLRYLWGGLLTVAVIALVTVLLTRYVSAQVRVARIKDELVSAVSHELKTPLANIRALADTMLGGRYRNPEQLHSYLKQISNEGERLTHLIDNFLAFSRMERGKHHFRFAELDLNSLVSSVADAARRRFQSHPVDFQVEVKSTLPTLRADEDALTTVLVNLLDNACKYSGSDKRIILRAHADATQVTFEVQDNGIGLSEEERPRVFERFYQADQSLTRRGGGCGLGLSIVQYIVRSHRGTIEVESEPGEGSLFRVRLPLAGSEPPSV